MLVGFVNFDSVAKAFEEKNTLQEFLYMLRLNGSNGVSFRMKNMRFTMKELLLVEEEIIDSLDNAASKVCLKQAFDSAKAKKIPIRRLVLRLKRQIIQGYSNFETLSDVKELIQYKRYMIKNSHIYGDYNENKIQNTKAQ